MTDFERLAMIHWLTTMPRAGASAIGHPDAGQRGWRTHAVPSRAKQRFSEIKRTRAACGLIPKHGWGSDMFIVERCKRCLRCIEVERIRRATFSR